MAEIIKEVEMATEIKVCCNVCGDELNAEWFQKDNELVVDPCETCMQKATDDGYNQAERSR